MANELNIDLGPTRTGLTVTATLILGGATVGSPVSLTETTTGFYSGNMPSVSSGVYSVRFLSSGSFVGEGVIHWDGAAERTLLNLPTTAQLEARTLPTANYFDPAADTVATVTSVTNAIVLPTLPTDWITAAGLAADAVAEIQAGLSTYDGSDTTGTTALLSRLTETRAGYLNAAISSRLAAISYTEPLTILQTAGAVTDALTAYTVPTLAQTQAAGFTTERNDALISANNAALAVADGRHKIDYLNSIATQYDVDGNVRTIFDLLDVDGNPATTAQAAVERVPQP